ncbi:hypothetical protein [Mycobacterium haemophilum]|nr:hypothetical protein [Mycobacterium haemophilum]MCV7342499.1 hypothetical protein [Mycobacterium haemophilum DSM 44634]
MKVPWFAEHAREEPALHTLDITGDDGSPSPSTHAAGPANDGGLLD